MAYKNSVDLLYYNILFTVVLSNQTAYKYHY